MNLIRVRIRASGQVLDMVPAVATAMILGGTAERLNAAGETMALEPRAEQMIAPAQSDPGRKKFWPKGKR